MSSKRQIRGINGMERYDGKVPPPIEEVERTGPSRKWRKLYKCKKNKGDHTFTIFQLNPRGWRINAQGYWEENNSYLFRRVKDRVPYWVEWHCTGCNKRELEWRTPDKKFDKYRHHIYETLG